MDPDLLPIAVAAAVGVAIGRLLSRQRSPGAIGRASSAVVDTTSRVAGSVTAGAIHGAGLMAQGVGVAALASGDAAHAIARSVQRATNGREPTATAAAA